MNLYKFLISFLSLPITIYLAVTAIRHNDMCFFIQRMGLKYPEITNNKDKLIWFHAASVGEVNAARPLLKRLSKNHSIILTTNTPSSAKHAIATLSSYARHIYCPIDWQRSVNKFIRKAKPEYLFIIETELWPNLFSACHQASIPVTIINGRISSKTLNTRNWIKKRYLECFKTTKKIMSRNDKDMQRFITLGADQSIVTSVGNIKFYMDYDFNRIHKFKTSKPYVLAASTRNHEEKLLVSAWLKSHAAKRQDYLLVIAPRHPHRLKSIIDDLQQFKLNIAIRSKDQSITSDTDVYIADTFGELVSFIKGSEFVLMGGSFVEKGGQNIMEVAHAKKAVVFGASMYNFEDEAQLFLNTKAGLQVNYITNLPDIIDELLFEPDKTKEYQKNALKLIQAQKHVYENYLHEIEKLFPEITV